MPSPVVNFRVSPEVEERMQVVAKHHGRTVSDELRMAWSIFDTMATLDYLQSADARAELGDGHAAAVAKVKADLGELTRLAFDPDPLLDADVDASRMN